jgi:hypothetical protein
MPKVDFKSIGREIRNVQKQFKATRARAGAESQARLTELISALDRLHAQTAESCPKGMAGEMLSLKKTTSKSVRPKRRSR